MARHLRFQTKLTLLLTAILFISNLAVSLLGILMLEDRINAEKMTQTRHLIQCGVGILQNYSALEKSGELKRDEAERQAKAAIKAMLFGEGLQDYFWIQDLQPVMIMHPFRKDLEGKNVSDLTDPDGLYLFREFVRVGRELGSGYVKYKWQYYSDKNRIEDKLSRVELFKPWGWILGTGIYTGDVREAVTALALRFGALALGMIIVSMLVGIVFARRLVIRPLFSVMKLVEQIAQGDLTQRIVVTSRDELGELAAGMNRFVENLREDMKTLTGSADGVYGSAREMSVTSQSLSTGTEEISQQVQSISAAAAEMDQSQQVLASSIEEMSTSVAEVARRAAEAAQSTGEVNTAADRTAIITGELSENTQAINSVTELIGKIAGQVNLLALNAAIEAASAGDAGRGFAVVAAEVKELAQQTTESAEDIRARVKSMQDSSFEAVNAIGSIKQMIVRINDITATIAASVEEQSIAAREIANNLSNTSKATNEVSRNISGVAEASRDGAKSANEVACSSQALEKLATDLRAIAGKFKI